MEKSTSASEYLDRGNAYCFEECDNNKAIAAYSEAIRLAPDYAEAYCARGLTYSFMDDREKAVADCNEAIRLDPDCRDAYIFRADIHETNGDIDKAVADLTVAIRIGLDDDDMREDFAGFILSK